MNHNGSVAAPSQIVCFSWKYNQVRYSAITPWHPYYDKYGDTPSPSKGGSVLMYRFHLDLFRDHALLTLPSRWNATSPCQLEGKDCSIMLNHKGYRWWIHFETICFSALLLLWMYLDLTHEDPVSTASDTALLIDLISLLPNPRTRSYFWKENAMKPWQPNFEGIAGSY